MNSTKPSYATKFRVASALLAALCAAGTAAAMTPAELYAKLSPSVWVVRTYDKEGLVLGLGSAVVIAPETLITNCHVLRKASRFVIARDNTVIGATLEMWDTARDVCQIKARNLTAPAVELGDTGKLVVGQPVYTLGSPKGLELTFSSGMVSSLRRDEAQRLLMIQTSAPISTGSSGGGLFDEEGRLIGVTSMLVAATSAQNLNFALPVDYVRELPQRHLAAQERAKPASAVAAAAPVAAAATPAARSISDKVPFLDEKRQARYEKEFLTAPLPRAFAVADNGHFGYAWGTKPKDTSLPADPKERALRFCATAAGKPCMLYAVDNEIVYQPKAPEAGAAAATPVATP